MTSPGHRKTDATAGAVTSLSATSSVPSQSGPNYTTGTVVTLTATLGVTGHKVVWTNTAEDTSTALTNTVTIGAAALTVTAGSACDTTCTLTVSSDYSGCHVTVELFGLNQGLASTQATNPLIVQVPATYAQSFPLTAYDVASWPFAGWASPAVSTGTCTGTITMNGEDQTVRASFPDESGAPAVCSGG